LAGPRKQKQKQQRQKRSKGAGPAATWQLQTAKARFSEVVRRACTAGPQVVTKQGKQEAVVLGMEDFKRLTQKAKQPASLLQFFAQSPLAELAIDLERRPDYGRGVDL
jgi:prevent-host-death family protein